MKLVDVNKFGVFVERYKGEQVCMSNDWFDLES